MVQKSKVNFNGEENCRAIDLYSPMSDWEDEDDWENGAGQQAINTFDDEEDEVSSEEEDETLAELAQEKRDA